MSNTSTPSSTPSLSALGSTFKAFGSSLKATTEKMKEDILSAKSAGPPPPGGDASAAAHSYKDDNRDPSEIPKEELMELCIKMSKKVKVLQAQKKELVDQLKDEKASGATFLHFFTSEVVELLWFA